MIALLVVWAAAVSLIVGLARIAISWVAAGDRRDPALAGNLAMAAPAQWDGRLDAAGGSTVPAEVVPDDLS